MSNINIQNSAEEILKIGEKLVEILDEENRLLEMSNKHYLEQMGDKVELKYRLVRIYEQHFNVLISDDLIEALDSETKAKLLNNSVILQDKLNENSFRLDVVISSSEYLISTMAEIGKKIALDQDRYDTKGSSTNQKQGIKSISINQEF